MLKRIFKQIYAEWKKSRNATLHSETLRLYRHGTYPKKPTIGIGQAYAAGLLAAIDLCKYEWTPKALHEGPTFLNALRQASATFRFKTHFGLHLYQPKTILDITMSPFAQTWATGWAPESDDDKRSSTLRIIHWIHTCDPDWIGNHLDCTFFSSNMSVWNRLLYHDISTSVWAMQTWPERLRQHTFPWRDWLDETAIWLYPILKKSSNLSKVQWISTTAHMSEWSPFRQMVIGDKLRNAISAMEFPNRNFEDAKRASDRGLFWQALTYDVPASMSDPIGAALACAWPDMHPDCIAIKRHFYPVLENVNFVCDVALPNCMAFTPLNFGAARATASLYESAEEWVVATLAVWEQAGNDSATNVPLQLDLPSNFMD